MQVGSENNEQSLETIKIWQEKISLFFDAHPNAALREFIASRVSGVNAIDIRLCSLVSFLLYKAICQSMEYLNISSACNVLSRTDLSKGSQLEWRLLIVGIMVSEDILKLRADEQEIGLSEYFMKAALKEAAIINEENIAAMRIEYHCGKKPVRKGKTAKGIAGIEPDNPSNLKTPSIQNLYGELRKHVIGQDELCKLISVRGWMHLERCRLLREGKVVGKNTNLLFIGDSGTGKTLAAETFGRIAGVKFCSLSATEFTSVGIVGADLIEDTARAIVNVNNNPSPNEMNRIIGSTVLLDEWTKKSNGSSGINTSASRDLVKGSVQGEALRMMEGSTAILGHRSNASEGRKEFSFDGIMFIFSGYIPELPEIVKGLKRRKTGLGFGAVGGDGDGKWKAGNYLYDALESSGLIPEFLNRLSGTAITSPLSIETLMKIATYEHGTIATYNSLLAHQGLRFSISDNAVQCMAEICFESGMAGRGLRMMTEYLLEEALFENRKGNIEFGLGDVSKALERLAV